MTTEDKKEVFRKILEDYLKHRNFSIENSGVNFPKWRETIPSGKDGNIGAFNGKIYLTINKNGLSKTVLKIDLKKNELQKIIDECIDPDKIKRIKDVLTSPLNEDLQKAYDEGFNKGFDDGFDRCLEASLEAFENFTGEYLSDTDCVLLRRLIVGKC